MPPAFGAAGVRSGANSGATNTPALPAGITAGQCLLAVVSSKNNASHTWPAGWTKITQVNSGASFTSSFAFRVATGTDSAPAVTWTGSVGNQGQVFRYTGTDTVYPIGNFVNGTGTTSPHAVGGWITSRPNSFAIYLDTAAAATALTAPSGYTSDSTGTGNTSEISVGHLTAATPNQGDSTDVVTISSTGAAAAYIEFQIELLSPAQPQQLPVLRSYGKGLGIPRINPNHPLAKDLLIYLFDTGDGQVLDLVKNRPGTRAVGATKAGQTVSQLGPGINWNGSDGITFAADSAIQTATANGNWTAACAFMVTTTAEPTNGSPFGRTANNDGSQPFVNWSFNAALNGVQSNLAYFVNTGGSLGTAGWGGLSVNQFTSAAMVARGTTTLDAYAQGFLTQENTGQTIQSLNTNDSIGISALSNAGIANPFQGVVFYGGFWARAFSAAEILTLHLDPFGFLIFPSDKAFDYKASSLITVTSDLVFTGEALSSIKSDEAIPGEMIARLNYNFPIPGESLSSIRTDLAFPGESLITSRTDEAIAGEALSSIRFDAVLPGEALSTLRNDLAITGEALSLRRIDAPMPGEALGTLRADEAIAAEALSSIRADEAIPGENTGAITVTVDGVIAGEFLSTKRTDEVIAGESISTIRMDNTVPAEFLITARSDEAIASEALSSVKSDEAIPGETLARMNANEVIPGEFQGVVFVQTDAGIAAEFLSAVRGDSALTGESLQSIRIDEAIVGEALKVVRADASITAETMSTILLDAPIIMEWLARQVVDAPAPAEALSSLRRDLSVPGESLVTTQITIDAAIGGEWATIIRRDMPVSVEYLALTRFNFTIPAEWIQPQLILTAVPGLTVAGSQRDILKGPVQVLVLKGGPNSMILAAPPGTFKIKGPV